MWDWRITQRDSLFAITDYSRTTAGCIRAVTESAACDEQAIRGQASSPSHLARNAAVFQCAAGVRSRPGSSR
jgi:hypothetical protein